MQVRGLEHLSTNKLYGKSLIESLNTKKEEWVAMIEHPNAETLVPEIPNPEYGKQDGPVVKEMKKIIIVKIMRPDRFIAAVKNFVSRVLGEKTLNVGDLDLMKIVDKETQAKSPLLLVSAPGFDASYKVDMLAKQANKKYVSVAIGSPEAFELVDKAIKGAAKTGSWDGNQIFLISFSKVISSLELTKTSIKILHQSSIPTLRE